MKWPLLVLGSYLLGSVSFAVAMVWLLQRRDLREMGSGNAGATNVLRAAGKGPALAVLLLDLAKGMAPVALAQLLDAPAAVVGLAALAAVLGHVFPIFFGFRGGKGVATAAGAFAILLPGGMLSALVVFALVVVTTRFVSLGSIVAALTLPGAAWLIGHYGLTYPPPADKLIAALGIGLLVLFKHQANVRRLVSGSEHRLGEKDD